MSLKNQRDGGRAATRAQTINPPLPFIPTLTDRREIDVDALEGDLDTYVNYPGIHNNDTITVKWRGTDGQGLPFDDIDSATPVFNPDPVLGQRVQIKKETLLWARGGAAFYSYQVLDWEGTQQPESLRLHCLVGLVERPEWNEQLPVVQVLESHDRVIDYSTLGSGATVIIPYYQALQIGDVVKVVLNGEDDSGSPVQKEFNVSPKEGGAAAVLSGSIPRSQLRDFKGRSIDLHYTIILKGSKIALRSPTQTFEVLEVAATEPYLPAMEIVGFSGGVLDPEAFKTGLVIKAKCPVRAEAGDVVLCHWLGDTVDNRHVMVQRLDASSQPNGVMQFGVSPASLDVSVGDDVDVFFQIARQGWAVNSQPLSFKVERVRGHLLPPNVIDTTGEDDGAVGSATQFEKGAKVQVPSSGVREGDRIKVNWQGNAYAGNVTVEEPDDPTAPLLFTIPPDYIAANMELNNASSLKRFPVTYTLVTNEGELTSDALKLRIQPVPPGGYHPAFCDDAESNGELSKKKLVTDPNIVLPVWPFMAVGNTVTLKVTGMLTTGVTYERTIRDAVKVEVDDVKEEMVVATVPLADVKNLKSDTDLHLWATISFDDGESFHVLPNGRVMIRD